jgi:hypothetical protein
MDFSSPCAQKKTRQQRVHVSERNRKGRREAIGCNLEAGAEKVVGEGQHAAAGVVDQHDLAGVEKVVGDDQGADHVLPKMQVDQKGGGESLAKHGKSHLAERCG